MSEDKIQLSKYSSSLKERLSRLPLEHRIAFATSTCERLFPFFYLFSKNCSEIDKDLYRNYLDKLWDAVVGKKIKIEEAQNLRNSLFSIGISEDDEGLAYFDEALEALSAMELTFDALIKDSAVYAAKATSVIVDSLLFSFIFKNLTDKTENANSLENIRNHPLMLKEKKQQDSILNFLEKTPVITNIKLAQFQEMVTSPEYDLVALLQHN